MKAAVVIIQPHEPCLDGHFTGDPMVPGVVILQRVFEELSRSCLPRPFLRAIPVAKFLSPLRPGEALVVETAVPEGNDVKFRCHVAQRTVAVGTMTLEFQS